MKTVTITEDDVRAALGPISGYSPLANDLIRQFRIPKGTIEA